MTAVMFHETRRDTEYDREAILEVLPARKNIAAKHNPTRSGRSLNTKTITDSIVHSLTRVATLP
jgi:hypothetical protein